MKQLEIRLDPAAYDDDGVIVELVKAHSFQVGSCYAKGEVAKARRHVIALEKILDGSNPVAPFVKACCRKTSESSVETKAAYLIYDHRVRRGLERPLGLQSFQGKFRQAVRMVHGLLPRKGSTSIFEGMQCHDT